MRTHRAWPILVLLVVVLGGLLVSACGGETSPLQKRFDTQKPTAVAKALEPAKASEPGKSPTGKSGSFASSGFMTSARADFAVVMLGDGRVVAIGGRGKGSDRWGPPRLKTAEIYDPGEGGWTEIGTMGKEREALSGNLLVDGRILVTGGRSQQRYHKQTELWDPESNSWSKGPNMKTPRWLHAYVTLPDGRAMVIGGTDDIFALISEVEVFDPVIDQWSPAGEMTQGRALHTATLLPDGRVLVTGGGKGGIGIEAVPFDSAEVWDPAGNVWADAGKMATARVQHTGTLLSDGRILVTGSVGKVASAEIWDPQTNGWSPAGSMSRWRAQHTATLLPDGRVLVAGGLENGDTTDIYDPATGAWSEGKRMSVARYAHSATRLADGTALFMGGQSVLSDGARELTNSTEVYTP